mgnify:CR=1 FL=1
MPTITLSKTQFLKGISAGGYQEDGLFRQSFTKGIDVFRTKATYGLLQQGYDGTDLTGSIVKDTIKWFVQKVDDYYGYGVNGYLYKFTGAGLTPSELDSAGRATRLGARGLAIYNDGTAPTLTTTASRVDIISLYWDGTTYFGTYTLNYVA